MFSEVCFLSFMNLLVNGGHWPLFLQVLSYHATAPLEEATKLKVLTFVCLNFNNSGGVMNCLDITGTTDSLTC